MSTSVRGVVARVGMGGWLFAVWLLLWGRADALVVVGGVIVVAIAYWVSRLPAVPTLRRVRPLWLVLAALEFAWDLLLSSLVIAWHALYRPREVKGAIVEVDARTRSELILLAVTTSISLRPGTLLVDLDWDRHVLHIHAMPVRSQKEADAARDGVLRTEHRLMRALVASEDAAERDVSTREDR
ncbi:Na+/H+ antiporter subunit E [Actinomadura bangladeshensis]|jgi:multicomponent Na+:H+ antiporter subunit E|uniref:Na+/H+ antiporter subunit E n=1 Tax=Actinomadura bangladeshensis TaxID=453573 RepID=A0A6L9QBK8_9ACTN|nr:Na+/H+ antiporter subunit E [Actinomadura bangladeshensis]NEA22880.1 Na+/H+ antiporter subunit E [Actinomadura bangladeshensis]